LVEDVKKYLQNQQQHHRRMSFQDEFRELCRRHGLELDEQYAWDEGRPVGTQFLYQRKKKGMGLNRRTAEYMVSDRRSATPLAHAPPLFPSHF
jgi:hypothetical protein